MKNLDQAPSSSTTDGPGFVGDLLVEVFLARGAAHHDDLHEAADELRELFACFGILSDDNEALIRRKIARLANRAGRSRLRLVTEGSSHDADAREPHRATTEKQFPLPLPERH